MATPRAAQIRIRGARQNNLAGVDVDLPRGALVAITGVSGSGKSSLAFDTLYREGQRRFLETLSAYARQFLGELRKPAVDSIEGLAPAIAVDQKSVPRGARSTVGTLTEITDHLRVLFARAGVPHCPSCEVPVQSRTPEAVVQEILRDHAGRKVVLCAPLVRGRKGQHKALLEDLRKRGFVRVRVDGEVHRLEEVPELGRYQVHDVEVVVDRLKPDPAQPGRVRESVDQALELGGGDLLLVTDDGPRQLSVLRTCPGCGAEVPPLEPRLFSFNSPRGACEACEGLGVRRRPSEARVVADPTLSIRDGALAVMRARGGALNFPKVSFEFLEQVGEAGGFDLDTPWEDLTPAGRRAVLHGTGDLRFEDRASWSGQRYQGEVTWNRRYRGVIPALLRSWGQGSRRKQVEKFLSLDVCDACGGSRLGAPARAVRLGDARLHELCASPVAHLVGRLDGLGLDRRQARIAQDLLQEVRRRAEFLERVGLGYLTLDRAADSLSGGEAQRIRLAAQLGAGLQGVMYVLDEPSIGLHARDQGQLLSALEHLRDGGNSVVVVEHDEATLRAADWVVDVGPGAGRHGGHVLCSGPPEEVAKVDSPTGRVLRGEVHLPAPEQRRVGDGRELVVRGARAFNLKDLTVSLPLGTFTVVTGVSGSGKSTLIQRVLRPAVLRALGREGPVPGEHRRVEGLEHLDDLVTVDASPIGRTTRSNPATYTGVMTPIRDLFAQLPESRVRGYTKSRFSFNVEGGRCEECKGAGAIEVELQFLSPVTVPCEECGGRRFQRETLDVLYQGHSIADVLDLSAEEAAELFRDHPRIARPLDLMVEVGLGYLSLGQPSTTISGGEAQRMKLVTELQRRPTGHTLYLLDEPTTGLHQEDVGRLLGALQALVDKGHSVVVIEHNLELVQCADHVVDLGPEGGAAGGTLVVAGTPEEVEACPASHTGRALRDLQRSRERLGSGRPTGLDAPEPSPDLWVEGARTHNLKNVDVRIPRDRLTVVTGPSGSGKSSLALDTIHTEGRRRFVESLSTYARQFLGVRDRPPFERMTGLGPSVAVEARAVGSHPRSTVATTTEIHDHLRVLFARAGTPRCPDHGEVLKGGDPSSLARRALKELDGTDSKGWVVAPVLGPGLPEVEDVPAELERHRPGWTSAGFVRLLVDGQELRLDGGDLSGAADAERVDLVIDRLTFDGKARARLAEAIEQAAQVAGGRVSLVVRGGERHEYSTRGACTACGFQLDDDLEPRHFSFNTHAGACPECHGLGDVVRCDAELLLDDPDAPLGDGAIGGKLGRYLTKGKGYYEMLLRTVARAHRIDLRKPVSQLTAAQRALLFHGEGAREEYRVKLDKSSSNFEVSSTFTADWPGLCGQIDAWHQKTDDPEWAGLLERVMRRQPCEACAGERLAPGPRFVEVARKRLPEVLALDVEACLEWLGRIRPRKALVAALEPVLAELNARIGMLARVGLGYLTLDRSTATLSGGEARRVRLSASLGSELVGVCYVLDEPTVGLHPRDVDALIDALRELTERGNTVLVVEHDDALMRRADHVVDMGPGSGEGGGQVVASGTPAEIMAHPESGTGRFLRGELRLEDAVRDLELDPEEQRPEALPGPLALRGARQHNLRGVDLEVRFGEILGLCGPSGSGKSSLVLDCLVPALQGEAPDGRWRALEGDDETRTVVVDAAPIGRTPHSVPATYAGLMDPLRRLFTRTPDARQRGYTISHFSFNSNKGRCQACDGRGASLVEMQFLADLWLTCEECDGKRFQPEVLEVRHRGKNMADVLAMSVDEAAEFLEHQPACQRPLRALQQVGLGYLRLGQSATTLSGGEAQRLKLASELQHAGTHLRSVVVLDEPSTGLSATDLVHLARSLRRLALRGNAVVLIEHNTELLALCDRLLELGPDGGAAGGRVVAAGTPAELAADPESITGPFLLRREEYTAPRRRRGSAASAAGRRTSSKAVGGARP